MAFKKGVSGNPKGKPAGSKNKTTGKTREVFQMIVEGYHDKIISDLDALDPKDRLKVILEMSQYFLPKMQATSIDANVKAEVEERNSMYVRLQQMYGNSREVEALHGADDEYETFDPDAEIDPEPTADKKESYGCNLFGDGKGGGYAAANSDSTFYGKEAAKEKKKRASKKPQDGTSKKA